ncbi:MAG TPA: MFS transporter [Amycolatopsis sp.]|uniref:MFS transporter n=1 Tax=Amycolatopsis sp. TaxID=37632 RepID=UPI002B483589|nr:MFS transporter [Amycolatopsis sp.]HKS47649.1 MFS transporter [Amycolatopsis sp.]
MSGSATLRVERTTRLPGAVWFLAAGMFVIAIGFGIIAPSLPAFAARFDVGTTAIGLVVSAFGLARLLAAPLTSRIVHLFGERSAYFWGILTVGACTGLCALAAAYWQLLAFRGLAGVGSAMLTVSSAVLVVGLAGPGQRGRATGLITTAGMLGRVVGPVVGALLQRYDVRLPFAVYAVMMAAVALVGRRFVHRTAVGLPVTTGSPESFGFRSAVRHPTYRAALAANFAIDGWAASGLQATLLPLFIPEILHADGTLVGVALSVFATGSLALVPIASRLTDRIGRKPVALVGLASATVAIVVLGIADSSPVLLAASFASGAGAGMLNPPNSAAAADVASMPNQRRVNGPRGLRRRTDDRSAVLAGFQMAGDTGSIVGPLAVGAMTAALSYQAACYITAAIAALAGLAWLVARETAPVPSSRIRHSDRNV